MSTEVAIIWLHLCVAQCACEQEDFYQRSVAHVFIPSTSSSSCVFTFLLLSNSKLRRSHTSSQSPVCNKITDCAE